MFNWLKNLKEELKEKEKQKIIQLYLECYTQKDIAKEMGLSEGRISQILNNFITEEIKEINLVPDSLQLFNVWNFASRDKTKGLDFKGVSD